MENGYHSFATNFKDCCARSCTRLAYEKEKTDPDFITASQECSELYQSIQAKLSGDELLLNRFDAAKNNENAISVEFVYQQGFQDCIYLLRWIGLL